MTIRGKLLATYLALTVPWTVLLAGYILWSFRTNDLLNERVDLAARATAVAESVTEALEEADLVRVHLLVRRHSYREQINIRVFRPDGSILATSAPVRDAKVSDWLSRPGMVEGLQGRPAGGVEDIPGSPTDEMYEARPLIVEGKVAGVLRMSSRLEHFQRQFEKTARTVLIGLVFTFALCAGVSAWLARGIAAPIQRMRNFAVRIGGGHFGERLHVASQDELGQLADALNRMAERLASIEEDRRGFLANVSHELRTPVSNVHVTLEALESGADEEPDLRARFIRTCLDETGRLSRLVEELLDLGRLEAGATSLNCVPVALRALVSRSLRAIETRMRSRGIRMQVDLPDIHFQGDPERLQQALLNLLDNALKHTLPETTVFVTARTEGGFVRLEVRDQGLGISEADLPHIFDEFYTADRSRRRGGGTGLGLAIARRIVEAHGGDISVISKPGKGAAFRVRLPLRPPPKALETSPEVRDEPVTEPAAQP